MKKNLWKAALAIALALLPLCFAACPGEQSSVPYYPRTPQTPQNSEKTTTISGAVDYKEAGTTVPVSRVYAGSAPVYSEDTELGRGDVSAGTYRLQIPRPGADKTVYFFVQRMSAYILVGQTVIPAGAAPAVYNIAYNRPLTTISGTVSLTIDSTPVPPVSVIFFSSGGERLGSGGVNGSGPYTYSGTITRPASDTTVRVGVSVPGASTIDAGQFTVPADAPAVSYNITCAVETTGISGTFNYRENGNPATPPAVYVSSSSTWSQDAVLGYGSITPGSPDTYTASIIRPASPITVYFYVPVGLSYIQVGSTSIPAGVPTATYNISYNNTNVTTLSGSLTYTLNGSSEDWPFSIIIASTSATPPHVTIDGYDDSVINTIMTDAADTSYTLSFPKFTKNTKGYLYVISGPGLISLGNLQVGSGSDVVTHNLIWNHLTTTIHGTITGAGADTLANEFLFFSSTGGLTSTSMFDSVPFLGYAQVASGFPFTYTGTINRPAATQTVYIYRMGAIDLETIPLTQLASVSVGPSDIDKEVNITVGSP
jgi:hypothetical protein